MALPTIKVAIFKKQVMQRNKYHIFTSANFSEITVYFDLNDPTHSLNTKDKKTGKYTQIIEILELLNIVRPIWTIEGLKKIHGNVDKKIEDVSIILDEQGKVTNHYKTMARIRLFKSGVYRDS